MTDAPLSGSAGVAVVLGDGRGFDNSPRLSICSKRGGDVESLHVLDTNQAVLGVSDLAVALLRVVLI